jgi:hypothetical protein
MTLGQTADALLASLGPQRVAVGPSQHGGLGLIAREDAASGAELLSCPVSCLLHAPSALASSIGLRLRALRFELGDDCIDDRAACQLLLLHHRHLGAESPWAAYIASLPGAELVAALPAFWDDALAERALGGTPLRAQAREARQRLEAFHTRCVEGGLCARWPAEFPRAATALPLLRWAHAVFWSRALRVELPGGARECLVPLLDLANHRPGAAAELRVGGGRYVLRAGRALSAGEEVHINYGAKASGELLRCHGFVLPCNQADVHEVRREGTGSEALCSRAGKVHLAYYGGTVVLPRCGWRICAPRGWSRRRAPSGWRRRRGSRCDRPPHPMRGRREHASA